MVDKEYLEKLKQEDYIAWDSLANDPMLIGQDSSTGCIFPIIGLICIISVIVSLFLQ